MPFEKGNNGNPNGRAKAKEFAAALRIAIMEAHGKGGTKLRAVADALVAKAIEERDVSAIKEIADRLDGKVAQGIVGDEDGTPMSIHVIIGGNDSKNPA